MKKFIFVLPFLASFSSFASACGAHDEYGHVNNSFIGFGFTGGVISTLLVVVIVLSIMLLNKNRKK